MEIKITKYLMVVLTLIMVAALIWGGHEWGIAKGKLVNGSRALAIIESNVFTPAVPIDADCLGDVGC